MGQCVGAQVGHRSEASHFEIVVCRLALGHAQVRCVGQRYELGVELLLYGAHLVGKLLLVAFQLGGACFLGFGFVALALLEEHTNLFGDGVLLGFHSVAFLLQ